MSDWVNAEGFLDGYIPPKRKSAPPSGSERTGQAATIDLENEQGSIEYGITIPVLKCPRKDCRSMDIALYSVKPWEGHRRKKYYRCLCCNKGFRETEVNKD